MEGRLQGQVWWRQGNIGQNSQTLQSDEEYRAREMTQLVKCLGIQAQGPEFKSSVPA